jgi:hypothetical protein
MRHIVNLRGFATNFITAVGVSTTRVFYIFSDTEMIVNRYDSTAGTTTGRGWFFRWEKIEQIMVI